MSSVVAPVDQANKYPDPGVPPVTVRSIDPLACPLQSASTVVADKLNAAVAASATAIVCEAMQLLPSVTVTV
jgi:hypothetical protein